MADSKPIFHLNGSAKQVLFRGYHAAYKAVEAATDAVGHSAPHGRDYYVSADLGAYYKAVAAHRARMTRLAEIQAELLSLVEHCAEGV